MKLYISREADRDQVCMILCRNGYTVRQGGLTKGQASQILNRLMNGGRR